MGSTIVDGPEVYEDRDPAQREAEGPKASMDYSEFKLLDTKKTDRTCPNSSHTRVELQERPLQSAVGLAPSPSPSRGYSLVNDPSGLRAS